MAFRGWNLAFWGLYDGIIGVELRVSGWNPVWSLMLSRVYCVHRVILLCADVASG